MEGYTLGGKLRRVNLHSRGLSNMYNESIPENVVFLVDPAGALTAEGMEVAGSLHVKDRSEVHGSTVSGHRGHIKAPRRTL